MTDPFKGFAHAVAVHRRENYLPTPMPSARDRRIGEFVGRVRTEADYRAAAGALSGSRETVLCAFAERMATLAVREGAAERIIAGLRATMLSAAREDLRDAVIALALLGYSTNALGLSVDREFARPASDAGSFGQFVWDFLRRPRSDQSIQAMGYSAVHDENEFRFRCDW
ncbi:hypothetical protein OG216_36855 [Streptomycetaceae bacterium NBC_01309]